MSNAAEELEKVRTEVWQPQATMKWRRHVGKVLKLVLLQREQRGGTGAGWGSRVEEGLFLFNKIEKILR